MEDFYEHIDDYKSGTLAGDALTQFEAELGQNASLRLAVENFDTAKSISEGLLEVDMLDTLTNLKNINSETSNASDKNQLTIQTDRFLSNIDRRAKTTSKTKTTIFNFRNFIAAASIIGVVFFAGWWMTQSPYSHLDKEQVFASFVDPVNENATKSVDTVGMTEFEKGMHFYALNRFEDSEKWLELSLNGEKDKNIRSRGYYWLGAAHLRQWEVAEAKEAWGESDEEEAKKSLELLTSGEK